MHVRTDATLTYDVCVLVSSPPPPPPPPPRPAPTLPPAPTPAPPSHHLRYLYPPPTHTTLTNIANALACVPKLYVQVWETHLISPSMTTTLVKCETGIL